MRRNTMARGALERAIFTLIIFAIRFVRIVAAIVLVVTAPSRRNALAIGAPEFRFRALTIFSFANGLRFIAAVTTVIGEITNPLSENCRN